MTLTLTSPAFGHNGSIPKLYTCQGQDISPALAWSGAPPGTKSFMLIVDDPDAPMDTETRFVSISTKKAAEHICSAAFCT